jgi:hypothetical protein
VPSSEAWAGEWRTALHERRQASQQQHDRDAWSEWEEETPPRRGQIVLKDEIVPKRRIPARKRALDPVTATNKENFELMLDGSDRFSAAKSSSTD